MAAQTVGFIAFRFGGTLWFAVSGFVLTLVILIFAEVTPKTLAALHPERIALPAAFLYYPLLKVLWPMVWLINSVSNGLLKLIGVNPEKGDGDHLTIDELRTLVTEAGALLPKRRHQMLVGILELQDITVDDIMIPHNEVIGIDLMDDWDQIIRTIRESSFTRLPVYNDSIDDVIGILHMKRLLQSAGLENLDKRALTNLVEDPYFVPEGTPLNKQLVQFQHMRQRTAFIVDEYGDIQGIITIEDILEEIVGEFTSEPVPAHADVRKDDKAAEKPRAELRANTIFRAVPPATRRLLDLVGPHGAVHHHRDDGKAHSLEELQISAPLVQVQQKLGLAGWGNPVEGAGHPVSDQVIAPPAGTSQD